MDHESFDELAKDAREDADPRDQGAPVKKLAYSHIAAADMMIAHPEWDQGQVAAQFGYSESWFSQIVTSDAFQALLMKRHAEVCDPQLVAVVEARLRNTMTRSLELLHKKLAVENPPDNL